MAKGNMLLGHARGKVGDLVFSRQNGQQVTRARAAVVRNPQTEAQMIQRIIMNTVAQAYSKMSPIVDHSFEGIKPGQQSMSHFIKVNINNLRQVVAQYQRDGYDLVDCYSFSPLGSNKFAANMYTVAKGQLPPVEVTGTNVSALITSIPCNANSTYQDIISNLGLQRGDQLTFICVDGGAEEAGFSYARIILDPHNEDGSAADLSVPFTLNGAINLPSPKNEGSITVSVQDDVLNVALTRRYVQCAAVIVSRKKSDGTWMRSNATMYVETGGVVQYGTSMWECLQALQGGDIDTTNPLYLNNAGSTSGAASTGGATPIAITAASRGANALAEGDHANAAPGEGNAISGTYTGNNANQKIYSLGLQTAKPVVGQALQTGTGVAATMSDGSFTIENAGWAGTTDGTRYNSLVIVESGRIKSVFCTYVYASGTGDPLP